MLLMLRSAIALALLTIPAVSGAQYKISHHFVVGGDGGWDYVVPDSTHHRLFIGRQDRVMVVEEMTGKLVGEVKGIHGAHGTAIDEATGHGFATSGDDSSIVMFDLKTFKHLARAHAAEDADAIIFDPASHRVFSFNGDAHSATVVDPKTGKFVANIDLGGKPEYGVSAGSGMIYVNLTDKSEVVEVDGRSMTVTRRWSASPCAQPVAMAIDRAHGRLFSGCRSGVMAVSDIAAGRVVATVPIGQGTDGAAFDPASGDAFASNLDGTLTIIHQDTPDTYRVVQTLPTAAGSRNMGFDPVTRKAYVVGARFGPAPEKATKDNPRRRPAILPGTFEVMVIER